MGPEVPICHLTKLHDKRATWATETFEESEIAQEAPMVQKMKDEPMLFLELIRTVL
jgi:hypothetical protein